MHQNFTWYLPSVYGDISLSRVTPDRTKLTLVGLSPTEKEAVKALLQRAVKPAVMSTVWATATEVAEIDLGSLREQTLTLNAPLSKVQDFLQKKLKPHRKQVSAVRFTSGRLEELSEATLKVIDSPPASEASEDDSAALASTGTDSASSPSKTKDKPERAVTVAKPVLGCPAPDFDDVAIRANRVLAAFLDPEQVEDFNTRQQFVAIGADTGHRYLLTSRTSRFALGLTTRSLFDIDENTPLCVHDWEVPAAEELLGLFVHISLPGLEGYVRSIPDREGILHG